MISVDEAKRFAAQHFPNGPEQLATKLSIEVREAPLTGCDGWVLSAPAATIIRLNSTGPAARRRFTLAHELGHLLLGIPTVIGESIYDALRSDSEEERAVNDLASELLLPETIVRQQLSSVPVVAKELRKLAKSAKVSDLVVAIRVANLAQAIGLVNASVAFFRGGEFEWHWSRTLNMTAATAVVLFEKARASDPEPARINRPAKNDVIVASMVENPGFDSATLFVQLLPAEMGAQLSREEQRRKLEDFLYKDDDAFRMSLQGVFGAFRPKCKDLTLEQAITEFYRRNANRWQDAPRARLNSEKGREYVRLRLTEWCK